MLTDPKVPAPATTSSAGVTKRKVTGTTGCSCPAREMGMEPVVKESEI